jgi:hypothetical protein
MLRRWKQDLYRSAPYQYCTENGVLQRGRWRPLKAVQREQLMGFRRNHTLAGLHKHENKSEEAEDVRRSLVGNSFNVYAISVFIAAWLFGKGLAEGDISLEFVCGIPTGRRRRELLNYLSYLKRIGRTAEEEMTWGLHRRATFRGGDVRRGGFGVGKPDVWPRQGVASNLWKWRTVVHYRRADLHINMLEALAVLVAAKWRTRSTSELDRRWFHLTDSQVCQSAISRGRSKSDGLNSFVRKLNALLIAAHSTMLLGYVPTDENPADAPSRWTHDHRARHRQ